MITHIITGVVIATIVIAALLWPIVSRKKIKRSLEKSGSGQETGSPLYVSALKHDFGEKNAKDLRKAECPYCHQTLGKIPSRKTKCPHCGEFMFVRTRPKDNTRVVATKREAEQIDEDWSIAKGTHSSYIAEKEEFGKERETLKKQFGKEPSENDIKWGLCNKKLIEHAQNGDWGLYRNTRFEMANLLRKESKLEDALRTYLEVCYLDLNGPNNTGGIKNDELLKEFPPFDPDRGSFLAPGVIDSLKRITRKLGIDKEKMQNIFLEHNSRIGNSLGLPLSAKQCWPSLEKEI